MKLSDIIRHLEYIKNQRGDLEITDITKVEPGFDDVSLAVEGGNFVNKLSFTQYLPF